MAKPARSLAARRRLQTFPPLALAQLAGMEQRLGGRQSIVGLLTLAPLTPDLRYLLGLLGDPQHQSLPLADLCAQANVLPGSLLEHLAGAALLRGKVQAAQQVGDGIAAVVEDVMRRAAPFEDACHTCRGVGTLTPDPTAEVPNPVPAPCDVCLGTGKLTYRPEVERQKLALDLGQLLPKSAGIQIAMQQNNGSKGPTGSALLDRLQVLSDQLLYGEGADGPDDVAEAELVATTPDSAPAPDPARPQDA